MINHTEEAVFLAHQYAHGVEQGMESFDDPRWGRGKEWWMDPVRFIEGIRLCGYEIVREERLFD